MAYVERDREFRTRGWRDIFLIFAAVGALAAGLLLSGRVASIPDAAQLLKEVTFGNYADAEIYLDSALSINPSNPFALLNIAVVCEKTGRGAITFAPSASPMRPLSYRSCRAACMTA